MANELRQWILVSPKFSLSWTDAKRIFINFLMYVGAGLITLGLDFIATNVLPLIKDSSELGDQFLVWVFVAVAAGLKTLQKLFQGPPKPNV